MPRDRDRDPPSSSPVRGVALVTGASSGFGLLASVELARRGFSALARVWRDARAWRLLARLLPDRVWGTATGRATGLARQG